MARITVEDCDVENRFMLVAVAAERAKQINAGATLTIEPNNDKASVLALREIAAGNIDVQLLRENLIKSFQLSSTVDPIEPITEDTEEIDAELNNSVYFPDSDLYLDSDTEVEDEKIFEDDIINPEHNN